MKGSFRKRGNKWSFTVDVGRDPATGKRKQKTRSGFKTKKEAQAACAELITELEKGSYQEPSKLTVKDFALKFIESQIKPNYRPATVYNYEKTLENHIAPYFQKMYIGDIKPMHVQEFYSHLMKEKGLGPGSIKIIHGCFRRVMQSAVEWNVIHSNPVSVVKNPKITSKSNKVWDLETCLKFLEIARKHSSYFHVYQLTIFTGLRRGEVLGIPIDNIDFDNNAIKIDQQLIIEGQSGKAVLTPELKSKSSYRTVSVPGEIMKELKAYIHERKKELLKNGYTNKDNLLFCSRYGNPLHPNGINKDFRLLIAGFGFEHIPFHSLRHGHATMLAEMKESVHAISQRLGHASVTITNEVYIHLTEKMQQDLTLNLDSLYKKNVSKM